MSSINPPNNNEIPPELKNYITQCFKEYHIKDCLVVLPANISPENNPLLTVTTPGNKYIIRHISSIPSSEGLCINLTHHDKQSSVTLEDSAPVPTLSADEQLHELIGEYMSRLATLVEQSSSKESKPAAVWKHRNFLSSISHQVKTPLSAIFSGTKLIKHYTDNEYIDRICEYMNQSCVELTRYMNDIIDFYYLKQGVLVLDDNRVNIYDTLDYVYENYRLQMQDAEIEFIKQIDQGIPSIIHCDDLRLTQILMNLIDNAVKFTVHPVNEDKDTDHKLLALTKKQVVVHAFVAYNNPHNQPFIKIQVADTGIGRIDIENQDIYFQPFNQTTRNWLNAPDGIGLGLCLSRDFAKLMGGTLKFISPNNLSITTNCTNISNFKTCIELSLPLHKLSVIHHKKPNIHTVKKKPTFSIQPCDVIAGTHTPSNNKSNTRQLVLIDDNKTNLELLTLILEQLGYPKTSIKSFTNSLEGQKYITDNHTHISHAIIDIKMPRKNGFDLVLELAPNKSNIHFILLTALNHDDIRVRLSEIQTANPKSHISLLFKPIDCAELKTTLGQIKCAKNRKVSSV